MKQSEIQTDPTRGLPKVVAYLIRRDRVAVECPYCQGLHFHGDEPGIRAPDCARLPNEDPGYYYVLPSTPAPTWILERIRGKWRTPVADAMIPFRGARTYFSRREKVLDVLRTALRDFPDFAERTAIRMVDGGMSQKAAEYAELEEMLAKTGQVELADAALVILRRVA